MNKDDAVTTIFAFLVVVGVIGFIVIIFMQPQFEANAFNKFSDKKAGYWDAFWGELRITP